MLPLSSFSGSKDSGLGIKPQMGTRKSILVFITLVNSLVLFRGQIETIFTNRIPGLSIYLLFIHFVEMLHQCLSIP